MIYKLKIITAFTKIAYLVKNKDINLKILYSG